MGSGAVKNGAFVVTRSVPVRPPAPGRLDALMQVLTVLPGVLGVRPVDSGTGVRRLRVTYDAARIGYADLEGALSESGCLPVYGWWDRLRAAWYRYLDENARGNAGAPGGSCCSNPADVYARKDKGGR